MATPIDKLLVEIRAETSQLRKEMKKVQDQLKKTEDKTKSVNKAFKTLAGVAAALGLGMIARDTVQTIRQFEDLEATLRAVTGSSEGAAAAMAVVRDFTAGTTFQIQEVTAAFIRLKLAGVVPTTEVMQDFGNFAAGMGRSIEQLAQAAFNATTGEMEMLKQFGVRAVQEGDKITVTFNGITKEIDRSGEAIIEYLRSLGATEFPNALEERLNTLSGSISNLKDATSEFQVAIGEGGITKALTDFNKEITETLNNSRGLASGIGQGLTVALNLLLKPLEIALNNLKLLISLLVGASIMAAIRGVQALTAAVTVLGLKTKVLAVASAAVAAFTGNFKALAAGAAVATGTFFALSHAERKYAEETENATDKDAKLNETVTVQEDKIGKLTKKYKELAGVINKEFAKKPSNLFDFGAENARQDLDAYFKEFQQIQLEEAMKANEMVQLQLKQGVKPEDVVIPLSIDPFAADDQGLLNPNMYREKFLESLGIGSEAELEDILNVNVISPVQAAKDKINEALGIEGPTFLEGILGNQDALQSIFDMMGGVEGLGMSFKDFQQKLENASLAAKTELSAVEEAMMSVFGSGAKDDLDIATEAVENNEEALKNLFDKLVLIDETFADMSFQEFSDQYAAGVNKLTEAVDGLAEAQKKVRDQVKGLAGDLTNQEAVLKILNEAVAQGTLNQDQANSQYRDFLETTGPMGQAMAQIGEQVESISRSFSNEFANAMLEGQLSMDTFKNFARNVVQAVIASFMELLVIQPIVDAILGAFSLGTTGGGTKTQASGGRATRGAPTLVGERGPEIFVPDTNGNVLNGMNTRNALAGGGSVNIVQNLNFSTGVVPTVRAEISKMLPQIAEVSKEAVRDAGSRGGSYRRSLLGG